MNVCSIWEWISQCVLLCWVLFWIWTHFLCKFWNADVKTLKNLCCLCCCSPPLIFRWYIFWQKPCYIFFNKFVCNLFFALLSGDFTIFNTFLSKNGILFNIFGDFLRNLWIIYIFWGQNYPKFVDYIGNFLKNHKWCIFLIHTRFFF